MASWHEENNQYLSAALAWLRLRLQHEAESIEVVSPSSSRSSSEEKPKVEIATKARIAEAAKAMIAAEASEPPPALIILSRRLGLSRFEQDVLLLCAAMEFDPKVAALCAKAHASFSNSPRPYPTFGLALTLFDEPAWDVFSPERPLRYWRLLEINGSDFQPLAHSPLRADERIVNYIKGLNYVDDRLTPSLMPLENAADKTELSASQIPIVETIMRRFEQAAQRGQPLPIIHLTGSDAATKRLIAQHAAAALGVQTFRLPVELLTAQASELETFARLWQRESLLLPVALYVDAHESERLNAADGATTTLDRFLSRVSGIVFLDTVNAWPELRQPAVTIDVVKPSSVEQQEAWSVVLGTDENTGYPQLLANQFNLDLATIRRIGQSALDESPNGEGEMCDQLWNACLVATRPRLDTLAERIDLRATWDDIVLPATEISSLRQIASQVRQRSTVYEIYGFSRKTSRSLGINALFAGESGTGKTMAAEVIANDLRLDLYRIDLSAVVSKYIGETEKNLRRLFDAAEDSGVILFFDEADALFGKRSEVKDSHDRYANIEINYLLQRMETYRGLAILATNMKSALDSSFLRRLRFIVNFPFPGIAEREMMWTKVFPRETPVAELDYERLSRLNLTGASIGNVAINAAFLAAQVGTPVTMPLILEAARAEFRKLERPINEADFR